MNNNIEGFFVEIKYFIRKNGYLVAHTILKKALTSNHLAELSTNIDLHLTKYGQLLSLGDFNAGVEDTSFKNFCSSFNLTSMIKNPLALRTLINLLA